MTQGLTSACFCGAVRLELTGAPNVQAYCHCGSCRGWLGAPIHGATLWPTPNVKVIAGADELVTFTKTEASHRQFCRRCGSPVRIVHRASWGKGQGPGRRSDIGGGRALRRVVLLTGPGR